MPTVIEVPGVGPVEFPDGMSDEQIAVAIRRNSPLANLTSKDFNLPEQTAFDAPMPTGKERLIDSLKAVGQTTGSAMTGAAHGISSGTGPISRLIRDTMIRPEEKADLDKWYAQDQSTSAQVGNFVGGAYTPEAQIAGGALGGGFNMARRALASKAGVKAGEALGAKAIQEAKAAQGALNSEVSRLGGYAQDLNRKVEWVIRLVDEEASGQITPMNKLALDAFRKTPEYAEVVNKAAERVLKSAPGSAARVTAQEGKVAQMTADLPQTIADKTMEGVSPKAAWSQVSARLKRYWPRLAAAGIGGAIGGPVGAGAGAAVGFAGGPMVRAVERMLRNPAVQHQGWNAVERFAQSPATGAASWLTARGIPATYEAATQPEPSVDPDILSAAEARRKLRKP